MKTIVFEDNGQDFLEWDLDDDGVVVDCRPFQGWLWCGKKVANHETLQVGQLATFPDRKLIRYPIEQIRCAT